MLTRVIEMRLCRFCDTNADNPRPQNIEALKEFFIVRGAQKGRSCSHETVVATVELIDGTKGIEFGPSPEAL